MLVDTLPRYHARYASLPVLGPYLDGLVEWLRGQGYPDDAIRRRISAVGRLDARLGHDGVRRPQDLSAICLLAYAPSKAVEDVYLSAVVRSFTCFPWIFPM